MSKTSVALSILCAVAGCDWVFPFEGQPAADRAAGDGTRDVARPSDLIAHREPFLPDGPVADVGLSRDAPKRDAPKADKSPSFDTPSSPQPCATGVSTGTKYGKSMAVCGDAQGAAVNQCTAASLCGSGWHVCTASEYLARGGATIQPGVWGARLASCVRENGGAFAPTDKPCAVCDSLLGKSPTAAVAWGCVDGYVFSLPHLYVGAVTHTSCYRLGVNDAQHAAYWGPLSTGTGARYSVCCN